MLLVFFARLAAGWQSPGASPGASPVWVWAGCVGAKPSPHASTASIVWVSTNRSWEIISMPHAFPFFQRFLRAWSSSGSKGFHGQCLQASERFLSMTRIPRSTVLRSCFWKIPLKCCEVEFPRLVLVSLLQGSLGRPEATCCVAVHVCPPLSELPRVFAVNSFPHCTPLQSGWL